MPEARGDAVRGTRTEERSGPQPTTSPRRDGRAGGSRVQCLSGSQGRSWRTRLKTTVAAAVLAVPHLILSTGQADAACETGKQIDHREAASQCVPAGPGEGEPARFADIDAGRWRDWSWDSVAHVVVNGSARIGPREIAGHSLLLRSSSSRTVNRYELGDSLSDLHPYPRVAPTEWLSLWSVLRYAAEVPALTEGNGDAVTSGNPPTTTPTASR